MTDYIYDLHQLLWDCKIDAGKFYDQVRILQEDMEFFRQFMLRTKRSEFSLFITFNPKHIFNDRDLLSKDEIEIRLATILIIYYLHGIFEPHWTNYEINKAKYFPLFKRFQTLYNSGVLDTRDNAFKSLFDWGCDYPNNKIMDDYFEWCEKNP